MKIKLTERQHKIYNILISALAVAAVVLVIVDLSGDMTPAEDLIYRFILGVFVLDYIVRFIAAPDKKDFFTHNICDLIAILPLHTVFLAFKLTRLAPLLKLVKVPRILAFLYRPLRKANLFFNTNGFKYVIFVSVILILTGGVLIHFAEGMSVTDGIWWAFVTATTVGYGDISPTTLYGRIIAMVLMLLGIGLIGSVTSTLTSYFLNLRQEKTSVHQETLQMIQKKLDEFDDLSSEDVEEICSLLRSLKAGHAPQAKTKARPAPKKSGAGQAGTAKAKNQKQKPSE